MSLVDIYLQQQIVWRSVVRDVNGEPIRDIDGEVQYVDTTIAVRWQEDNQIIMTNTGGEAAMSIRVYTVDDIRFGDLLRINGRDWPVLQMTAPRYLNGAPSHREVML